MESISIIINNEEITKSSFVDTKRFIYLNDSNHLDLFIKPSDSIILKNNNKKFKLKFTDFYEIYSYKIKTLHMITFEGENYFIFVDIIQYYNSHFIKSIYAIKK